MATLGESAKAFVPKQTKNIADLPEVDTNLLLLDGSGKDADGVTFDYKYIELNAEEYRVPTSVLSELKGILAARPTTTRIRVTKSGAGISTRYKVIPLD